MNANDPDRCQWIREDGQCPHEAIDGSPFCKSHTSVKVDPLKHYMLTNQVVRGGAERHNAVDEIKSLREEIALTRAMIETRLNMTDGEADFISSMGIVHQYLATVEKLVTSCHRMDTNLGNLLNKSSILNLAQELVTVISEELEDVPGRDEIIDRISEKIITCIGEKQND
jgi:hypothetical protein